MTCAELREQMIDAVGGTLEGTSALALQAHVHDCASCSAEYNSLRGLWQKLDTIEVGEPSLALRERFYATLAAYREGLAEASPGILTRVNRWLAKFWPQQPVWQMALCAAFLAAGVLGTLKDAPVQKEDEPRLAQLTEEVRSMRQLVTLSLLQQQSASERLKGVNWSYRMEAPGDQVMSALLYALNNDENVGVRLAAADALYKFADSPAVRSSVRQSLPRQQSPLVQLALVEMLTDLRDQQAKEVFREVLQDKSLNPQVKTRIERNLARVE